MNYLKKGLVSIGIRAVSAGVGWAVEIYNLIDFKAVELFLIFATAILLVAAIYNGKLKKIFPYWLIIKSGFDAIYILTAGKNEFATGLIIAANIIFLLVFVCEYLINKVLSDDKHGRFTATAFTVCFLIPYIAIFLSLVMVVMGIVLYEIPAFILLLCLVVNACIFFKLSLVFVNLLLLTMKI